MGELYLESTSSVPWRPVISFAKRLELRWWEKMSAFSTSSGLWDIIAFSSQPEGRRNLKMPTMLRQLVSNFASVSQQSSDVGDIITDLEIENRLGNLPKTQLLSPIPPPVYVTTNCALLLYSAAIPPSKTALFSVK